MTIRQLTPPRWTVPGLGQSAAGYYVYTYQPGTSTPKASYADSAGSAALGNPFTLDAQGEKEVWWDGEYKIAVYTGDKDVDGVLVWTQDNYGAGTSSTITGNFNLAENGSFEVDTNGDNLPDNWTVNEYTDGTVALDTTDQYHGQKALKFTSVGTGGGYATSTYFEVQGSRDLPVAFAIKSSVAAVHNVVEVVWYTSAKAVISTTTPYDDTATNPTSWTFKPYIVTPPSNARFARVILYGCKDDDATVGSTWFDNVQVEAMAQTWFPNVNAQVTATDEQLDKTTFFDNVTGEVTSSHVEINLLDGANSSNNIASLAVLLDSGKAIRLNGTAPATPVANTIYNENICKAWANVTNNGVTASIVDDFNVSSVSRVSTGLVDVTFATSMANTTYCPVATAAGSTTNASASPLTSSTARVATNATTSGSSADGAFRIAVFGDQ